jgi:hypothetical protein
MENKETWLCQVEDCKNFTMTIRKYPGDYGLYCQKHSTCRNCLGSTNGWTCNICERCDKKLKEIRKQNKTTLMFSANDLAKMGIY